jgi:amino acid transporter
MTGVRLWWWLGTSLYPQDETPLPPSAHMRRARSGPIASVLFALITSALVLIVPLEGSLIWVAVLFVALDSLLVFGLGSLIPLGFNDGSTLLEWSSRRR